MGALLSAVGALVLAGSPCLVPSDQGAGWKRVTLPVDGPVLAAPKDVDQFRSEEPALWRESDPAAYLGAQSPHAGRMAYSFRMPPGATRLEVEFLESLRGAKVDATAFVGQRALPLLSERRRDGTFLALDWDAAGVDTVVVEVHYHLRERPVVRHWRTERRVWLSREASVPAAFKAPRSLYFRHPGGGRRVVLCPAPERVPRLDHWPEGAPVPVALTPEA